MNRMGGATMIHTRNTSQVTFFNVDVYAVKLYDSEGFWIKST